MVEELNVGPHRSYKVNKSRDQNTRSSETNRNHPEEP